MRRETDEAGALAGEELGRERWGECAAAQVRVGRWEWGGGSGESFYLAGRAYLYGPEVLWALFIIVGCSYPVGELHYSTFEC